MLRPTQRSQERAAFKGRVGFSLTYQTPLVVNLARRLEEKALAGAEALGDNEKAAIDATCWVLAHTTDLTVYAADHVELEILAEFWRWWMTQSELENLESTEFRRQILTLGIATQNGWFEALRGGDLDAIGPLIAPRAMLPDAYLTEAERADPKLLSSASSSETDTDAG